MLSIASAPLNSTAGRTFTVIAEVATISYRALPAPAE